MIFFELKTIIISDKLIEIFLLNLSEFFFLEIKKKIKFIPVNSKSEIKYLFKIKNKNKKIVKKIDIYF